MRYGERHLKQHKGHDDAAPHHLIVHCDVLAADGLEIVQQHGHRSPNEVECVHLTGTEIAEQERLGAAAFAAQEGERIAREERSRIIGERAAIDPAFAALAETLGLPPA